MCFTRGSLVRLNVRKQNVAHVIVITEANEWLTKGILTSCKEKNRLYKIYKCNPTIENEQIYKIYKNKLTHIIRLSEIYLFR